MSEREPDKKQRQRIAALVRGGMAMTLKEREIAADLILDAALSHEVTPDLPTYYPYLGEDKCEFPLDGGWQMKRSDSGQGAWVRAEDVRKLAAPSSTRRTGPLGMRVCQPECHSAAACLHPAACKADMTWVKK